MHDQTKLCMSNNVLRPTFTGDPLTIIRYFRLDIAQKDQKLKTSFLLLILCNPSQPSVPLKYGNEILKNDNECLSYICSQNNEKIQGEYLTICRHLCSVLKFRMRKISLNVRRVEQNGLYRLFSLSHDEKIIGD